MKKGMLIVTDLAIALLCAAGLFLTLLEDRFRLWATVAGYGAAYLLSLGVGWIAARLAGPSWAVAAGALVLFGASLFLSRNNPLQKFYLVLLTLACHFYLEAFLPPVLGAMPFPVAGAFAAVFSLAAQLALAALVGLCFYRPFHHFSDRGPSAFLWGMCLVTLALCAVGNGKVDVLFRLHIPAQRLLVASLLFAAVIFVFRSVYQAGRFRQGATEDSLRAQMLTLKAGGYLLLYSEDVVLPGEAMEGYDEALVFASGLSAKKNVRIELRDPKGNDIDDFNCTKHPGGEVEGSYGRNADGGWYIQTTPTPGSANVDGTESVEGWLE